MVKIRIRPISFKIKNRYDSILKLPAHCFVNALIQITNLPEDDYEVVSCEIFQPGKDIQSMDILLKGKNGYVNIEFHKQPLSKAFLKRDFQYVIQYFFHYDEIIDQRIIIVDNDRKSVNELQIMPNLKYEAQCYFVPNYNGSLVLNTIKNKIQNNEKLDDYEQYIFSILPLTNHGYDNVEELMEELCALTPELNIPEKNREIIGLCQLILIDLYVNDEYLKKKLVEVVTMTHSYIERRENDFKHEIELRDELLVEIAHDIDDNGKLNENTLQKLRVITKGI